MLAQNPSKAPDTAEAETPLSCSSADKVLLDHRYFPHIIDLIWRYMTFPSLIPSSHVSIAWRRKARPKLLKHVAMFNHRRGPVTVRGRNPDPLGPSPIVYKGYGSLVSKYDDNALIDIFCEAAILDAYPASSNEIASIDRADHWPKVFKRLIGIASGHNLFDKSNTLLNNIDNMFASDLVCFAQFRDGHFFLPKARSHDVRRLTLTLDCHSNPAVLQPSPCLWRGSNLSQMLSTVGRYGEFTIILKDARYSTPPAIPRPDSCSCCPEGEEPWQGREISLSECAFLGALLMPSINMARLKAINIVGVEAFVPDYARSSYQESLKRGLDEALDWNGHTHTLSQHLHFYTLEQYEDEVGEEVFRTLAVI